MHLEKILILINNKSKFKKINQNKISKKAI